jgi:hypothetical protein
VKSFGRRSVATTIAVLAGNAIVSCTVAFDLSSLQGGCDEDTEKRCADRCVPLNDPETGCAAKECAPCYAANGLAKCDLDNVCYMAECFEFWDDCDEIPSNGCETNLATNPKHCGKCNHKACDFDVPHAKPACLADPSLPDTCGIAACDVGFGHCDQDVRNGCETDLLTHPDHCGRCTNACSTTQTCVNGHCLENTSPEP